MLLENGIWGFVGMSSPQLFEGLTPFWGFIRCVLFLFVVGAYSKRPIFITQRYLLTFLPFILHFFVQGGEDYFSHQADGAYDFRFDSLPYCGVSNCSKILDRRGEYSTEVFGERAVEIINDHDTSSPLFLYFAHQGVHAGAQVPERYKDMNPGISSNPTRKTFAGMVSAVDEAICNLTAALEKKGMLENTIIVLSTDNGGPTEGGDAIGSSNYPLRGGKHTIWEGGIKGVAFVAGLNGTGGNYDNLMNGVDFMPTLLELAKGKQSPDLALDGVSHLDALRSMDAAGVPPPRNSFYIGHYDNNGEIDNNRPISNGRGIRFDDEYGTQWKYLENLVDGENIPSWIAAENCNSGNNATGSRPCCGDECLNEFRGSLLLFNISDDIGEEKNLAGDPAYSDIVAKLKAMADDFENDGERVEEGPPIDKSCGDYVWANDEGVGNAWQSWCSL